MLIRFLQAFSGVTLAPEAHPVEARTPEAWKNSDGPQAKEKVWPRSHLTMFAKVSVPPIAVKCILVLIISIKREDYGLHSRMQILGTPRNKAECRQ